MNEAVARVIKGITAIVFANQFEIKEIRTVLCDNNAIFAGFQLLLVRIGQKSHCSALLFHI
jgi:hypothetical protein